MKYKVFLDNRKKPINSGHAIRVTLVSQCTKREIHCMSSDENCMNDDRLTILVGEKIKRETKANPENQDITSVSSKERKLRKMRKSKHEKEIKEKGNFVLEHAE